MCVHCVCVCASTQCIKEIHRQLKASFIFITTSQAPKRTTTAIATTTTTTITTKTTIYDSKQAGPVFLWLSLAHLIESAFTHTTTDRHTHTDPHTSTATHNHPHPPTHTLAKAASKTNGIGGVGEKRQNKRN